MRGVLRVAVLGCNTFSHQFCFDDCHRRVGEVRHEGHNPHSAAILIFKGVPYELIVPRVRPLWLDGDLLAFADHVLKRRETSR